MDIFKLFNDERRTYYVLGEGPWPEMKALTPVICDGETEGIQSLIYLYIFCDEKGRALEGTPGDNWDRAGNVAQDLVEMCQGSDPAQIRIDTIDAPKGYEYAGSRHRSRQSREQCGG